MKSDLSPHNGVFERKYLPIETANTTNGGMNFCGRTTAEQAAFRLVLANVGGLLLLQFPVEYPAYACSCRIYIVQLLLLCFFFNDVLIMIFYVV